MPSSQCTTKKLQSFQGVAKFKTTRDKFFSQITFFAAGNFKKSRFSEQIMNFKLRSKDIISKFWVKSCQFSRFDTKRLEIWEKNQI